ncbi:phosphate acetyltransferase [Clostridium sp. DL1XJH146]
MPFMKSIKEKAKSDVKRIVLPEGEEERNIKAAGIISAEKIAEVVLVGNEEVIKENARKFEVNLDGVVIVEPQKSEKFNQYTENFFELRKRKGVTIEKAKQIISDPVYFATMMLKEDDVDGLVSGAIHTTGDLLRPGLQIIKTAPGASIVSSFFLMIIPDCNYGKEGLLLFGDCAVNPNPTEEQLASIAISTAHSAKVLCDMEPKVAMLSFSTMGSAKHELVEKVQKATSLAKEQSPDICIDGEMQLDAAIVSKVADLKAPGSDVAGKANVLIFPDLNAGNIGYKLVQRFANAKAIGPICQGFAKPLNDLSRGCSVEDIVNLVSITAVQAQVK